MAQGLLAGLDLGRALTESFGLSLVRIDTKVGYKKIDLNCHLAIPPQQILSPFFLQPRFGTLLDVYPLGFTLTRADLLTGAIGVNGALTDSLAVFATLSASIPRNVGIVANEGPGIGVLRPQAWNWAGSRLLWAQWDLGASYRMGTGNAIIGGLKWDRISVRISDPEPVPYYTQLALDQDPPFMTFTFPDYRGDLESILAVPYVGFRFLSPFASGSFLVGLASANLRLPLTLSHPGQYSAFFVSFLGRADLSEQALYRFNRAGIYLAANLEGESQFTDNWVLRWWGEATWTKIQGSGTVDLSGQSSIFLFIPIPLPRFFSASGSGDSHLTQWSLSFGLSSVLRF